MFWDESFNLCTLESHHPCNTELSHNLEFNENTWFKLLLVKSQRTKGLAASLLLLFGNDYWLLFLFGYRLLVMVACV